MRETESETEREKRQREEEREVKEEGTYLGSKEVVGRRGVE
jgi:hypothetical protein